MERAAGLASRAGTSFVFCPDVLQEFPSISLDPVNAPQEKGADDDLDVEKGAYSYSTLKPVDTGLRHCSARRIPVPSRAIGSCRGRWLSMKGTRKCAGLVSRWRFLVI